MSKLFNRSTTLKNLSAEYDLVDSLWGGTAAMIQAGTRYLPREPEEELASYKIRLGNSTLAPFYKRAITKGVGRALARGINVQTIDSLEYLKDNIDGSGTSLESFAKSLLTNAINYGISYILVDMPTSPSTEMTVSNVVANNLMPYMVEVKATNVLDLNTDYIDNQLKLTYFRFYEEALDYTINTPSQMAVQQVKEFILEDGVVTCKIYRTDKNKVEQLHDEFVMDGFTQIPIVPVYGNKVSHFLGSPTLIDLAYMNIKHWRKNSDLDHSEHYGLVPILQLRGLSNTPDAEGNIKKFVISANTAVNLPADGAIEWTKADAAGIKEARASLAHLEDQMEMFGLELTAQQATGTETATGRIIDAAESNSILKTIVIDLEWSIYNALLIAGDLINSDATETQVDIDKSFTVSNTSDINLLKELYSAGILTREEVRAELATRRILMSESINLLGPEIAQE